MELARLVLAGWRGIRRLRDERVVLDNGEGGLVATVHRPYMNTEHPHNDQTVHGQTDEEVVVGNGRYRLESYLGHGSFGTVWQARDLDEDDVVAVKLFNEEVEPDRVLIEARLHRRLSAHPRIVSIRNVDARSGQAIVLAMDLMSGGSIAQRLNEGDAADLMAALGWMRDVLGALDHAHAQGIIHRDLRLSNVLFDAVDHAMLSDFGVSEDSVRGVLANGHDVYAPIAAPELTGTPTSPRSDVWAAGCLLYRLTTGTYPFEDQAAARAGRYQSAHRLNPQVPHAVSRVIAKALATDSNDRYGNAGEMLQALAPQSVRQSWRRVDDPDTIETWATEGTHGPYTLTLMQLRSGRYRVAVAAAPGRRLLERRRADFDTIGRARQLRRAWLLQVVGGNPL